jgi:hypothetical protein
MSANYNAHIKQLELRNSRPYNIMTLAVGWEFAAMAAKQSFLGVI